MVSRDSLLMVLRDVLRTHSGVDPDIPDDRDRQKHLPFRLVPTAEALRHGASKSEEGFQIPDHKQHGDRTNPSRVSATRESETALMPHSQASGLALEGSRNGKAPPHQDRHYRKADARKNGWQDTRRGTTAR
jgi:hypothetical protein